MDQIIRKNKDTEKKLKKDKIKNVNYKKFLNEGMIQILDQEDIKKALSNVKGSNLKEARSLIIATYCTGARPNEILKIKAKDIKKDKGKLTIKLLPSKNGLPREMIISLRRMPIAKELYDYSRSVFPEQLLFYHFKGNYKRTVVLKSGKIKEYTETTDRLRYYFKIWFDNVIKGSISPYYLRHNRFSKMIKDGASVEQIRLIKGAKTIASVTPYIHMSKEMASKASKYID